MEAKDLFKESAFERERESAREAVLIEEVPLRAPLELNTESSTRPSIHAFDEHGRQRKSEHLCSDSM